ncbi:MAG: hypothetical protein D4R72_04710 [Nitrosopumilales archaeon]|nr:MAG: hypothetical protein D4R72_04710 [Nitrosopumilales archaeon]
MTSKLIVKHLSDDNEKKPSDEITKDYGTIIRESALLTTFAGFLFGFLLTISVSSSSNFTPENKIILLIAISSITVSISLFIMPVIYHHLEYPYIDFEKFKKRSHRFTLYGLVPAMVTLFLGIELAMSSVLRNNTFAYLLGIIPFVLIGIFYKFRK